MAVRAERIQSRIEQLRQREISCEHDPWDPFMTADLSDEPILTSIEVTATYQCNLRCEHCAVGEELTAKDERTLDLDTLFRRLDEVDTLVTFSLTGGEPAASARVVEEVTAPLLAYAKSRGLRTQVNTNLTLPYHRYEAFVDLVDVVHISYNYPDPEEFGRIAYAYSEHVPSRPEALLERLDENTRLLAERGVFVSAETILTHGTIPQIDRIHQKIAELGCRRHEIHPLYPSDFAASMSTPSLEEIAQGVDRLLDAGDPDVWILFGTFPFFACSPDPMHRELYQKAHARPNTTVRNDPDGRCRLNVSSMTGDVFIQDFADGGPIGNIKDDSFQTLWQRWLQSENAWKIHCRCPIARCLGPNLIVAESYFPDVDWTKRQALVTV